MTGPITTQPLLPELSHSRTRWRSALAGLTPQIVAIVAAILFARSLTAIVVSDEATGLAQRTVWMLHGLVQMFLQVGPMLLAIVAASNLGPKRGLPRLAVLAAATVLSSFVGVVLRIGLTDPFGTGPGWENLVELLLTVWPRYALVGGALTVALEFHRRELDSEAATEQARLDQAALERQMVESRLQALQAQIEPHFLFNTLANVRRLYDTDLDKGEAMLDNLMRYFEVALPSLRNGGMPLGREAELAHAYLQIQQIRMGKRLEFSIEVPTLLRQHPIPPLMLLTLVENAIKHGISPAPDGGRIRIFANAHAGLLSLSVVDSGVGFMPGCGAGVGLANIRARLATQFGKHAYLSLQNNEGTGVTATIVLPLQATAHVA